MVRGKIVDHLENNELFTDIQRGFRKGKSYLSELSGHFTEIFDYLNRGHDVDSIYLDFSKAFDKVDNGILLRKIHNSGIRGKLFSWIKEFLHERSQKVCVKGYHSFIELVISGVPQGTVLGPILFIIYINDMKSCSVHSSLRSFADDTRLVQKIESLSDVSLLQSDLDRVVEWSVSNNMQLNQDKFELMQHNVPNYNKKLLLELPFVLYEQCYTTPSGTILAPEN